MDKYSEFKRLPIGHEWALMKENLDTFLLDSQSNDCTAGFIRAPHGAGKSTTLLRYIWEFMRQPGLLRDRYCLLYVQRTALEADLLFAHLTSSEFEGGQLRGHVARNEFPPKSQGQIVLMDMHFLATFAN